MKRYRLAALLAAVGYFIAGFGLVSAKTMAYFDNPAISYSGAGESVVAEISPVQERAVLDIAQGADIKAPVVQTGGGAKKAAEVCAGYYGYVAVGGKNVCLKSTDTTGGSLSYSFGYIFNSAAYGSYDSYIFAHNSAGLFGGLKDLAVGTRFSVVISGKAANYQISKKVVYCDYSNPSHPCANYSEPVLNMLDAVRPARQGADLALMTCAGQGIGNGDATHRLIVFAVRV